MNNYRDRLNRVIPGGAHTYSRGFDQFPKNAPQILEGGKGAYVWDPEDNKFLDYGMALKAVTIGYANQRINQAAWNQVEKGNNLTRASTIELKAAELLVELIPSIDMVKFAKNGSNVTTAAVKLARSFTGREFICVPYQHPFFTFDDWFIGTTAMNRGVPEIHKSKTLLFDYNDISSLENLFKEYPQQIAGVMLEPATTQIPCTKDCSEPLEFESPCLLCPKQSKNFLHQVESLCKKKGALFILDEMITGFRWHLQGASSYFGVTPDLVTFGKGMANGFSVAAIGGKKEVMELGSINSLGAERTFLLSTTHGGEMSSLGAFIETVSIYIESDVCRHLWEYGSELKIGLETLAKELGIDRYFQLEGPDICLNYVTKDFNGNISLDYRTLFNQEMIKQGVLIPWISVSQSHQSIELDLTLDAARNTLIVYQKALENGIEKYLQSPSIKPVFRKYN